MYEYIRKDKRRSFNPCFNGSMYKNKNVSSLCLCQLNVSILVLMDLCIKTLRELNYNPPVGSFNPCFNGSMYKNLAEKEKKEYETLFQSLF